jgi:uncharacterized protein (TIGR02678 family)
MSLRGRRAWSPEASSELAALLRLLAAQPWLVRGRHDEQIAAVRRNLPALRDVYARLGWVLVVERDLVRLRKSPPPRRAAWARSGPPPEACSWFFVVVAAAESLPPRVGLARLVASARAVAAEASLPVDGEIRERRAIAHALRLLDQRGVIETLDGDVASFVHDEDAPVLLGIHHTRLVHVIANYGAADPVTDPLGWLEATERERDPARRMRRRLIDDAVVHVSDLGPDEADWLSRRVRGDDGGPLATAFGLHLERRAEGAAFVVPDEAYRHGHELGPLAFPAPGTVPHAALSLCERAGATGSMLDAPGPGWRGLAELEVMRALADLASRAAGGRGGLRQELLDDHARFATEIRELLGGLGLVRVDAAQRWWFSPATQRWKRPEQVDE